MTNTAIDEWPDTGTPQNDVNTIVGQPSMSGPYGGEIAPLPPHQNMFAIDPIAGQFPPQERNASPAAFTGGMGGQGLGGQAEPMTPGGEDDDGLPGTLYERRGF
jgi:hypothetical protein